MSKPLNRTPEFRRIRSRIFRNLVSKTRRNLWRDHKVKLDPISLSSLRFMYSTANNCAHMQVTTNDLRSLRREILR